MKHALKIILVSLFLLSCSSTQLFQSAPTATPVPTFTAIVFPTSPPANTPTLTATPDLVAEYLPLLPEIPLGFEWKILPEKDLAVVIPDGWFFKEETRTELNYDGIYVTQENIDETGRFSTGLSVMIFKDFESNEEAEQFAQKMLSMHANLETTKEILKSWDYQSGSSTIHHLRIRGEYPYETEVNKNKIVHYSSSVANNSVYWAVFESPESLWEETLTKYGIVLDYIVVFGH